MSLSKIVSVAALTAAAVLTPVGAHAADRPTAADSAIQVVQAGQPVDAGHGVELTLTHSERCIGAPSEWEICKSVVDGNQEPDSVSLQSSGDDDRTIYSPLYIGDKDAARMTLRTASKTYDVQMVTLAGHPGYSTGYVWGPPTGNTPTVTVYDAAGKVLAQL